MKLNELVNESDLIATIHEEADKAIQAKLDGIKLPVGWKDVPYQDLLVDLVKGGVPIAHLPTVGMVLWALDLTLQKGRTI